MSINVQNLTQASAILIGETHAAPAGPVLPPLAEIFQAPNIVLHDLEEPAEVPAPVVLSDRVREHLRRTLEGISEEEVLAAMPRESRIRNALVQVVQNNAQARNANVTPAPRDREEKVEDYRVRFENGQWIRIDDEMRIEEERQRNATRFLPLNQRV